MSSIHPVAIVTGASAGLGLEIAKAFLEAGYDVVGVGRDEGRLQTTSALLATGEQSPARGRFTAHTADVTRPEEVDRLFAKLHADPGRIDVLINCVGQSDRGTIAALRPERLRELFDTNVTASLLCAQAALPLLKASRGTVVNIGSLASKVGARHLGGYPAAKHALAGLTQQMRLEWREHGIHVGLVSPGPIRRDDAGTRYQTTAQAAGLPPSAMRPGGGTTIKGLEPAWVAAQVLRCVRSRSPDVVLPRYARLLVAIGHLVPSLGDWLLLKMTPSRE